MNTVPECPELTKEDLRGVEVVIVEGALPLRVAFFDKVLISVPALRDEERNTGDMHMKMVGKHHLGINFLGEKVLVILVPKHYLRMDFPIENPALPGEKKCAVARHFYVKAERLGKKIMASVEVLKNSDGTLAVNILPSKLEGPPEFKISMRPVKDGDLESPALTFISGTDKCLEFVPIRRSE